MEKQTRLTTSQSSKSGSCKGRCC